MKKKHQIYALSCMTLLYSGMATAEDIKQFQRSWTGLYDERKISVFIQSIDQKQVKGYSLLGANKQNFSGAVKATPKGYKVTAVESGAKNSSGTFIFTLNNQQPNLIDVSWESATGQVKPKYFDLKPQQCRYQKNEGDYPEASQRLLKDADLQMSPEALDYMRNEIYARHGYSFTNKEWAQSFAHLEWYMPCSTNVDAQLTSIEKTNIDRIKKIQPYMSKMEWGR